MKIFPFFIFLSLVGSLACGSNLFAAEPTPDLAGHWEGAIRGEFPPEDIEVDFARQADRSWQATITIPDQNLQGFELNHVTVAGSNVGFDLSGTAGTEHFVGMLTDDSKVISGDYAEQPDAQKFPFKLERGITRDPQATVRKLVAAAGAGDVATIKKMLSRGADIDGRFEGLTPLFMARMEGQKAAYDFLLQQGADARAPEPTPTALVDTLFTRLFPPDGPGAAVLVARHGKILFEKGYGLANVKQNIPITTATRFCLGYVTNQFTAAAILRLQETGKLKIADPLSKYYPDFPRGDEITLRHLLGQTSGIHNYNTRVRLMSPTALIASIEKLPYDFKPGAMDRYSMSNYFILSDIVEKVSGLHYGDFLRKTFFDPLGMKETAVLYHNAPATEANAGLLFDLLGVTSTYAPHDTPPPNVASGYLYKEGRYQTRDWADMSWVSEASALYSTVEDLYRWNEAVFGHKVLSNESLATALAPVITEENKPIAPAFGRGFACLTRRFRGSREISDDGNRDGFAACILYLPDQNFTVVILTNAYPQKWALEPALLANKIVAFYLGAGLPFQPPTPRAVSVPASALAAIVGRYDRGDSVEIVSREGDRVFAQRGVFQRNELLPKSATEFFLGSGDPDITFVKDATGKVVAAIFRYRSGYASYAPRLPDIVETKLDAAHSTPILGQYTDGTGATWIISREGGHLYAQLTGNPKYVSSQTRYELGATSDTEFFLKEIYAQITFVKDAKGDVISAIIKENGGARVWQKVKPAVP